MYSNIQEKYLIIGADDFGICPSANKAIKELYDCSKITSINIIAGSSYVDEAIEYVINKGCSVGAHLTLNSDQSQHSFKAIRRDSSISDSAGNLYADANVFADKAKSRDVTLECKAQIEFLLDKGIHLDHIDNHSGTLYGINKRLFFINAFRIAREYNLPFRLPIKPDFLADYFEKGIPLVLKLAYKVIVAIAKAMQVQLIDNMISHPHSVDRIKDYSTLKGYYLDSLRCLKAGVTEMFLHPSYYCPIFSPLTKEWKKREWELEFLHSKELQDTINNEGIKLISYADLPRIKVR